MTRLDGPEVDVRGDGCEGSKIVKGCPRSGDSSLRFRPVDGGLAGGATPRRASRPLRLSFAHPSKEPNYLPFHGTSGQIYLTGCGSLVFCQNELKYSLGDM